jgi:hypothetical protein
VIDELLAGLLLYGVFPLWVIAGFGDYGCHRSTGIERTTGRAESALHAVQYAQIVAGLGFALFLETTSLVLVLVVALALLHLVTGYLDIHYTTGRRHISAVEQHVHSWMEMLPLVATVLWVMTHWSSFAPLLGDGVPSWSVTLRRDLPPTGVVVGMVLGLAAAGVAIAEEYFRCTRRNVRQHTLRS